MNEMIRHIKRWNLWRKWCLNSRFHKLLVLLKIRRSPTFELTWFPDEWEDFRNTLR